jgi:hypothetical protein
VTLPVHPLDTPRRQLASPIYYDAIMSGLLAPGWEQATDPSSGRPYYYCRATGESRWDLVSEQNGAPTWIAENEATPIAASQLQTEQHTIADSQQHGTLSAGQIADLCFLQKNNARNGGVPTYTPLDVDALMTEQRPTMETRRIEIRLHKLQEQIKQIQAND